LRSVSIGSLSVPAAAPDEIAGILRPSTQSRNSNNFEHPVCQSVDNVDTIALACNQERRSILRDCGGAELPPVKMG
jgi:hypothetical protein